MPQLPNVLLVAGPSSVGKSTASAVIGRRFGRTWLSTDDLRLALQQIVPEADHLPMLHVFERTPDVWEQPEAVIVSAFIEIARILEPGIAMIARNHLAIGEDIVIEGDALSPAILTDPALDRARSDGTVGMLVVCPQSLELIRQNMLRRGWAAGMSAATLEANVNAKFLYGQELARQAHALGVPVIDPEPLATLADRMLDAFTTRGR